MNGRRCYGGGGGRVSMSVRACGRGGMRMGWCRRLSGETKNLVKMERVRANLQDQVRQPTTTDNEH